MIEVIREADANDTSGELWLALIGCPFVESQLRIPKFEPEIMFFNIVPLVSVELEYHAEWCTMKLFQYEGIHRLHKIVQETKVSSCVRAWWGYVDVGYD